MESMIGTEQTLIHISHLHPLKLVRSPEPKPICHACKMQCRDQSFGCVECRYFLHVTCATAKRSLNHSSHPAHPLMFELTPSYTSRNFTCDACFEEGNTFSYRCGECDYDLHLHCTAVHQRVNHPSHSHPLLLVCQNPYPDGTGELLCDLCQKYLDPSKWFYLCRNCDFGGHIGCFSPDPPEVLSPGLQAPPSAPENPEGDSLLNTVNTIAQQQLLLTQARAAQSLIAGSASLASSFQWKNNLL